MGDMNLSLIIPIAIVAGMLLAAIECGARAARKECAQAKAPDCGPGDGGTP